MRLSQPYREVPLTRGLVALVDDEDYERVVSLGSWCAQPSKSSYGGWYAHKGIKRDGRWTTIKMHTLITGWARVDHIDHDGLNNRRDNLRPSTRGQNAANERKRSDGTTSRYKGVGWDKQSAKWRARIMVNQNRVTLGFYVDELEAAFAYDRAAFAAWGNYAHLNFPKGQAV